MSDVLVVDDSEQRRLRLRPWLVGQSVAEAASADEALNILRDRAFDVIFLDHDLGPEDEMQTGSPQNSGMTIVDELTDTMAHGLPLVVVHTLNTPRGAEMCRRLVLGGVYNLRCPFIELNGETVAEILRWSPPAKGSR